MTQSPRKFEYGSAFKDGKYYSFSNSDLTVVRAWPDPMAWRLRQEGPWRGWRPRNLDLDAPEQLAALPPRNRRSEASMRRLRNQARAYEPAPLAERRSAARYGSYHAWPVYTLLARAPGALELAEHNPALAFALAEHDALRPPVRKLFQSARSLLKSPGPHTAQRVAEWLGFEPSRATVRCLRKIEPRHCSRWRLHLLRVGFNQPRTRKLLLHAPALNEPFLRLYELIINPDCELRVHNGLVSEVAGLQGRRAERACCAIDILISRWHAVFHDRPLPELHSLEQIRTLSLQAEEALDELCSIPFNLPERFPEPPIPALGSSTCSIEPLDTPAKLQNESLEMRHCIGSPSYLRDSVTGHGYGYSVRYQAGAREQRATVWLYPVVGEGYRLRDCRRARNGRPSIEILTCVRAWIDEHNARIARGEAAPPPPPVRVPPGAYFVGPLGAFQQIEAHEGGWPADTMPF